MELDKLLAEIEKARREPLRVCCRTPAGEVIVTSIVADDLDTLLDGSLNHKP